MHDLINRQALIKHLRRTIEASSNDGDYNEGFNDGMDFSASFASILPSVQSEPKWIPCTERLPKLGEVVLWCNKKGSVFTSTITYMKDNIFSVGQHRDAIAWMPLPKPYKQGDQNEQID